VLAEGESVTDELVRFVADREIGAAAFTASGALRSAVLGFFDLDAEEFIEISVCEQAEVLSLTGVLGCDDDGAVALHAHAVLGRRNGGTCGGHLLSATVRPTLEVMVTESPGNLRRHYRDEVGLALIDVASSTGVSGEGFDVEHPLRRKLAP
jgi:predicted DNA-binding protein with PD1-like motif